MNIFVLDECPEKAAQYHCDKHVVKMVSELVQQMASVCIDAGYKELPLKKDGEMIKGGWSHHPCTRWIAAASGNYHWAYIHARSLSREYTFRYGKLHWWANAIENWFPYNYPKFSEHEPTPFVQDVPADIKHENAVIAYRDYYNKVKRWEIDMRWNKGRPAPDWYLR